MAGGGVRQPAPPAQDYTLCRKSGGLQAQLDTQGSVSDYIAPSNNPYLGGATFCATPSATWQKGGVDLGVNVTDPDTHVLSALAHMTLVDLDGSGVIEGAAGSMHMELHWEAQEMLTSTGGFTAWTLDADRGSFLEANITARTSDTWGALTMGANANSTAPATSGEVLNSRLKVLPFALVASSGGAALGGLLGGATHGDDADPGGWATFGAAAGQAAGDMLYGSLDPLGATGSGDTGNLIYRQHFAVGVTDRDGSDFTMAAETMHNGLTTETWATSSGRSVGGSLGLSSEVEDVFDIFGGEGPRSTISASLSIPTFTELAAPVDATAAATVTGGKTLDAGLTATAQDFSMAVGLNGTSANADSIQFAGLAAAVGDMAGFFGSAVAKGDNDAPFKYSGMAVPSGIMLGSALYGAARAPSTVRTNELLRARPVTIPRHTRAPRR
jgi:hypothetical protein